MLNLYRTLNIYKIINIYKILLFLNSYSRIYRVSKIYKNKANGLVLDTEKVTILLSINTKN